ncbi:MAG: SDR family oxidoreductase [Mesorhizobium sp.]|uniref:SDR family oxidoreductase n=1 Tax=Mesorhizobium sp. TaxID=1871066 RepID=UPI000FE85415|nr:SDR family oxidoreductase [Mesorhizobium sp.]RWE17060.1 MAG: SDR family oxidoreductase [Mesorhizobium sp.]
MRVFLTGATGFIGSRIVPELIAAGAEPHRGDLEDLDSLRDGAVKSDAVIHTAFDHNFSNFVANCEKDKRVIVALGGALAGSDRLLIITSGVGMGSAEHGQPAREDVFNTDHPNPRILSELTGAAMAEKGVKVSVVRLPQVHDTVKQGLITPLIAQTRAKGVSAYLGEGRNRWSAAHVLDVAKLYRLALDKQEAGVRYNAVAEEGIPMREIAEVIGAGLNVPVVSLSQDEAADHFGWLAMFAGLDLPASSEWTRAHLGWQPTGPGLIADLKQMDYSQAATA